MNIIKARKKNHKGGGGADQQGIHIHGERLHQTLLGGVGNLWGTLVAGLSLGVVNKFIEPVAGAVVAKILVLIFIILFIQKRPRGLFPQKGRAVED
mgnify:CR=1 FL=1